MVFKLHLMISYSKLRKAAKIKKKKKITCLDQVLEKH